MHRAPPRVQRRPSHHLVTGEPEQALGLRVAGGDLAVALLHDDALMERVDDRAVMALGVVQLGARLMLLGDVDARDHKAVRRLLVLA